MPDNEVIEQSDTSNVTYPASDEAAIRSPVTGHPRVCLFVLGMHRSGTSSVAGTLAKLGATPPAHLLGAREGNSAGHWESEPLVAFHDELLESAGSRWDDWRGFNSAWFETPVYAEFKARAKRLLAEEFGDSPLFVFKDPRNCRLAPFWLGIFAEEGIEPRIILPVRSPLEVARSHQKRDRFPVRKGLLLWLRHVLDAEVVSRDFARTIVEWRGFLSDWEAAVGRMEDVVGPMPAKSDLTIAEVNLFLDRDLKHHSVTDEELAQNALIHAWVADAYAALSELARNPGSNSARATLDHVRQQFDTASTLFGGVLADAEASMADLGATLHQSEAARQQLADQLEAMRLDHQAEVARIEAGSLDKVHALETAVADSGQQSAELQNQLQSARTEIDALRAAALREAEERPGSDAISLEDRVSDMGKELSAAEGRLAETQVLLQQAEAARVEELARSEATSEELKATRQKYEDAELMASQARIEIDLLNESRSQAVEERDKLILETNGLLGERDAAMKESMAKAEALATLSDSYSTEIEALRLELQQAVEEYGSQIAAMQNSQSWKLTAPFRASRDALAKAVRFIGKKAGNK